TPFVYVTCHVIQAISIRQVRMYRSRTVCIVVQTTGYTHHITRLTLEVGQDFTFLSTFLLVSYRTDITPSVRLTFYDSFFTSAAFSSWIRVITNTTQSSILPFSFSWETVVWQQNTISVVGRSCARTGWVKVSLFYFTRCT